MRNLLILKFERVWQGERESCVVVGSEVLISIRCCNVMLSRLYTDS